MWELGDDDAMLDIVTSANVACGFHAGDPARLAATCRCRGHARRPHRRPGRLPRPRRLRPPLHRRGTRRADRRRDLPDRRPAGAGPRRRDPPSATSNPMARCTTRSSATRSRPAPSPRRSTPSTPDCRCWDWPDRVFFDEARRLGLRTVAEAFADRAYRPDGQLVSRRENAARSCTTPTRSPSGCRDHGRLPDGSPPSTARPSRSAWNPFACTVIHRARWRSPPRCANACWPTGSSWRRSPDAAQARPSGHRRLSRIASTYPRPSRTRRCRHLAGSVAHVLVDDGTSALMTDGFFSRPSLLDVGLRQLTPSEPRIDDCLNRARSAPARRGAAGTHPLRPRDGFRRWSPSAPARELIGGTSAAQCWLADRDFPQTRSSSPRRASQ